MDDEYIIKRATELPTMGWLMYCGLISRTRNKKVKIIYGKYSTTIDANSRIFYVHKGLMEAIGLNK